LAIRFCHIKIPKKEIDESLNARQPVDADGATCAVALELDELLDGEDSGQVLNTSTSLVMASLAVGQWIPGNPSDVSNADHIGVEVSLENSCTAACGVEEFIRKNRTKSENRKFTVVQPGFDLCGLLQVLCMGVHLSQNSADLIVIPYWRLWRGVT
jgi:hypothetical protein